ncbi:MAG TPA: FAD-binding oxidoreductase [Polyangia bacterium]|jgi:alkyldihydroxyacetonephosphate synthase
MSRAAPVGLSAALAAVVDPARVSSARADRAAYARDLWPRDLIALMHGDAAPHPPDLIVWPETTAEVAAIVRLAAARGAPLVPFGGGTAVTGAAAPARGGIVLDLKRMNRLTALDPDALCATFEAGIVGEHLEHELGRRGFTMGHLPSSIACSTLGGWLATRSAGQASTLYGKIEDIALGLTVVTGAGEILETSPRDGRGPDATQLFIGSEGTLGVITAATMRVRPAPAVRLMRAWAFPRLTAGLEAIRRVLQRGLRPAVARLYDEVDTFVTGFAETDDEWRSRLGRRGPGPERRLDGLKRCLLRELLPRAGAVNRAAEVVAGRLGRRGCLLITGFEGDAVLAAAEAQVAAAEIGRTGGRDLGEAPGQRWLEHRYDVSYAQSRVFAGGAFVDTLEIAATWDRLLDVYGEVRAALARHALVMAHFSHAYHEGCSIDFTFIGGAPGRRAAEEVYDRLWRDGLTAALQTAGTISHHHGVGLAKAAFMEAQHAELMPLLRELKAVLDPAGIMNPGKLGL